MRKCFNFAALLIIPMVCAFLFSSDGPNAWTQLLTSATVYNDCIAIDPVNSQNIYAGANGGGVYKSTDGGTTWNQVNSGLTDLAVQCLTISYSSPTTLYAGCITGGVFKTTNGGTSWTAITSGLTELGKNVQAISIKTNDPNTAVCLLYDGVNNATNGIYKTTDGTNWVVSSNGILSPNRNFLSFATTPTTPNTLYLGGTYVAGTWGVHVYKSYNFGSTWMDISNGIDTTSATGIDPFRDLSISTIDTNTVLAGRFYNTTNGGPWLTTNAGANWIPRNGGLPTTGLIRSIKIRPGTNNQFFLGGNGAGAVIGGVFRTTNAGVNWFSFNSAPLDSVKTVRSLNFRTSPDSTLYAGVSAPAGTTTGVYAYTFVPPPTPLCEGFNSTGFPPTGWSVSGAGSSFWSRQTVSGFGLGTGSAMYDNYSAPNGTIGNLNTKAFIPAVAGDSLKFDLAYCQWSSFPNDSLIILVSSNSGTSFSILVSWGETQLNTASSSCTHPFTPVATDWGRRKLALPVGTNMISFSGHSGFGDHLYLDSICVRGNDTLTGINLYSSGVPRQYSLSQNYPNPFNPSTIIKYALPKAGYVQIKVYDVLGREVSRLVNEFKTAGYYDVEFNASNYASGVYFYKIESGTFTDTKKMLLIK